MATTKPIQAVEISVQATNDPNVKAYHTRIEMCDSPQSGTRGDSSELNEFGNLLLSIRGIVQVQMSSYIVLVTKAPLFDWSEVDSYIGSILKMFVASQKQLEEACRS